MLGALRGIAAVPPAKSGRGAILMRQAGTATSVYGVIRNIVLMLANHMAIGQLLRRSQGSYQVPQRFCNADRRKEFPRAFG